MTNTHQANLAVSCSRVTRVFRSGRRVVNALLDVSLEIQAGQFVCLRGASGSGKSTLLNIVGALDIPTAGSVVVFGRRYGQMSPSERGAFRRENVGFVFQELALVPHLTALENATLPLMFAGRPYCDVAELGIQLLSGVGLHDRMDHLPCELSYGEQQRVAIARASIRRPKLLVVDEPTANLDAANAYEVKSLFRRFRDQGTTILASTHDPSFEADSDQVFYLDHGRLVDGSTKSTT